MSKSKSKFPNEEQNGQESKGSVIRTIIPDDKSNIGPYIPIAEIGSFLVFKPRMGSNFINMIDLKEFKSGDSKNPYKTYLLVHEKVLDIAPLYDNELLMTGVCAVSKNMISIWQGESSLINQTATTKLDLEKLASEIKIDNVSLELHTIQGEGMRIKHIPGSNEILLGFRSYVFRGTQAQMVVCRIDFKNNKLISYFSLPEGRRYNLENMHIIAPDKIGFFWSIKNKAYIQCFSTSEGSPDHQIYNLPDARSVITSPDGRLILVKKFADLEDYQYGGGLRDYEEWRQNHNYTTIDLYQKRDNDIVFIKNLPGGNDLYSHPQFLANGCLVYSPSPEYTAYYASNERRARIKNFYVGAFDAVFKPEQTDEDPRNQLRIVNISHMKDSSNEFKYDRLATFVPSDNYAYVTLENEVFLSGNNLTITLAPDPILQQLENIEHRKTETKAALVEKIPSAGVMGLIFDYMKNDITDKPPIRLRPENIEAAVLSQIDAEIAKNQKIIDRFEKMKINKKELKLSGSDAELDRAARRCLVCLSDFKTLVKKKDRTFDECAKDIWKHYPDIEKYSTGFRGGFHLLTNNFKETADPYLQLHKMINNIKNYDVDECDIQKNVRKK